MVLEWHDHFKFFFLPSFFSVPHIYYSLPPSGPDNFVNFKDLPPHLCWGRPNFPGEPNFAEFQSNFWLLLINRSDSCREGKLTTLLFLEAPTTGMFSNNKKMREGVGARSCFFAAFKRELGLWEQQQIRGRIPNEVHWDHPEQRLARKKSFCASFCNPLFHSVFATILQTSAHTMFNGGETRLEEIQRHNFFSSKKMN